MKNGFMRKLLGFVLTFVLVLSMMPVTAVRTNAATGPFTGFTVGGTNVTGTQSGSNWSYDASSLTLTVTGNIGSSNGSLAINATTGPNSRDVLTVRVTKNATIKGGIYAGGKLHLIVDPGVTLKVDASGMDNALHANCPGGVNDTLKITGGGTVYAVSKGYGAYGKSGIWIENVTVAVKGNVYGLFSGNTGSIYIQDNSRGLRRGQQQWQPPCRYLHRRPECRQAAPTATTIMFARSAAKSVPAGMKTTTTCAICAARC